MNKAIAINIVLFLLMGCTNLRLNRVDESCLAQNSFLYLKSLNWSSFNSSLKDTSNHIFIGENQTDLKISTIQNFPSKALYSDLTEFCDSISQLKYTIHKIENIKEAVSLAYINQVIFYSNYDTVVENSKNGDVLFSLSKELRFKNISICMLSTKSIGRNYFTDIIIVFNRNWKILKTFKREYVI